MSLRAVPTVALLLFALPLYLPSLLVTESSVAQDVGIDDLGDIGPLPDGFARLHYHRPDGRYDGWGLHVWEDTTAEVSWERPLSPTARDGFGLVWDVPLTPDARRLGLIVHAGDTKDPGPDQSLDLVEMGREAWIVSGRNAVFTSAPDVSALGRGDLTRSAAHWLGEGVLAWRPPAVPGLRYRLHTSPDGGLSMARDGVRGGESIELVPDPRGLPESLRREFPHLADLDALVLADSDRARIRELLCGQLAVSAVSASGELVDATGVQIGGVLDDLYYEQGLLGVVWEDGRLRLRVWAPTARRVRLLLFSEPRGTEPAGSVEMARAGGTWQVQGETDWAGLYYLYEVTVYAPSTGRVEVNLVTDPYSRSLARNSERSQIVDLADPSLMPAGWLELEKPPLAAPEDIVLYELHVRDFSVGDPLVPEPLQGTFAAFTVDGHGRRHLHDLAGAGLTHVHLLPVFDIATVDEDRTTWEEPGDLSAFPPDSDRQQERIAGIRDRDPYNWGYDPYHYGVPEGSYSTHPDGTQRIVEFRQMVAALSDIGLRVVMDVVYNHTHASGQQRMSVLDRIVPGYYHRLDAQGNVTTSTCCQNTATEHRMMEKLMIDDLVHWAVHYKVDGFRFDLMGHHMRENLVRARDALRSLTPAEHGVDGSSIYLYGEGWDFGEVQGGARGVNATQANLAGTGIGTFNDRIRDAIRGGSPFTDRREQGYATGLVHAPNGQPGSRDVARLRSQADRIRVGLAGNLRDLKVEDLRGAAVGGYTLDPQEAVQYAAAHDNETLFDKIQLAAPPELEVSERARMQRLALGIVAVAQGVPFFHAGSDLLRSKSMDADSYNSGDWFNHVDWSRASTAFGRGLPGAEKNRERWEIMRPLLRDRSLWPPEDQIRTTSEHFRRLLRVRASSPLLRLRTQADVLTRVHFHARDREDGLIVMTVNDTGPGLEDLDPAQERLVVLVNPSSEVARFGDRRWSRFDFTLHPELEGAPDLRGARFHAATGVFTIPRRAVAVFVDPQ